MDGDGIYLSGMFTEVNGEILSYGINCPQIMTRNTGRSGAIFRFDIRDSATILDANAHAYSVRTFAKGSASATTLLLIDMDNFHSWLGVDGVSSTAIIGNYKPGFYDRELYVARLDNATNNVLQNLGLVRKSNNTVQDGFGVGIAAFLQTSTTTHRQAGDLSWLWYNATHASAVADLIANAYYNNGGTFTASEIWRGRAGASPGFAVLGQTPATRQAHISDPAGGGTQDAEARTAINSIIDTLEAFGFNATS